ncbi:ABC transporter ATP-binding protein [Photobacterium sp. SDRW27]|uniref:ABC transporter ATP-binding protein n=1 Tax=Photobacterium obscurum TaxID=2829490 RepID=UPI002244BA89|nr:ABC transporter ATP-binding protein [Photobacterium obscurum]MCW8329942.1 ABC transporter ATP-binding protein [Photobacterium obscurum]
MLNPAHIKPVAAVDIWLKNLSLTYKDASEALFVDLELTLPAGQWTCLLGKSGCGKTTLLRHLAGLIEEQVRWDGKLVTSDNCPLSNRIAYMAQQDLLLPWLSVLDNICLSYRFGSQSIPPDTNKALELLHAVGLEEYVHAMPDQLSGGMRQRVALARTLMQDKPLVLMDEPFSALDAVTRHKLQTLSSELLKSRTVLLITHDPQEALRLGHNIYIMSGKPAKLINLGVPSTTPPRIFDAEIACHQQAIIEQLEQDYG